MRISKNWLSDFLDLEDLCTEEFERLVTTRVAEVDEVIEVGRPLKAAIWVKILDISKHEKRDKLSLVKVSDGKNEFQLLSAAPGLERGSTVAFIPPGEVFYEEKCAELLVVEPRDIAGVNSSGLLVSLRELEVCDEHEEVLVLENAKVGSPVSQLLGSVDTILEIDNKSLTHRPDLWGHFGFARELSAITEKELKFNPDTYLHKTAKEILPQVSFSKESLFSVHCEKDSACRRLLGVCIEGVSAQKSPLYMRRRLHSIGVGSKNILIDLSNYVMHEIGQANHAYDADKLSGNVITARKAKSKERLLTLDGVERELSQEDIVIADCSGAQALAGVMGGALSAVSDTTKRLFVESANFDPIVVRKMCHRQALRTDASNRFEKSQSALSAPLAIYRFLDLLCENQAQIEVRGEIEDCFIEKPKSISLTSSYSYIRERLGTELSDKKISSVLSSLGFKSTEKKDSKSEEDTFSLCVPYYRATRDISISEDLVEEVGRIIGYENIPENAPLISSQAVQIPEFSEYEDSLRDKLCGAGFREYYAYSFSSSTKSSELGLDISDAVSLLNPIDQTQDIMRVSQVPEALEIINRNIRHSSNVSAMFEIGRVYKKSQSREENEVSCKEEKKLILFSLSAKNEAKYENVLKPKLSKGAGFYGMLSMLKALFGTKVRVQNNSSPLAWEHPFRAATLELEDGTYIGKLAEVTPQFIESEKLRVVLSEISLDPVFLAAKENSLFIPPSKFPDSFFEISIVAPKSMEFSELENIIRTSLPQEYFKELEVVSLYSGAPLKECEQSISIKLVFGSNSETLSSERVKMLQDSLVSKIDSSGLSLRG